MRLIVEQIGFTEYLELILTKKECERLKKTGVCTEFTGTALDKRYLNIFVRAEETEDYYAIKEGQLEVAYKREYRNGNEIGETSETSSCDRIKRRTKIKRKKERK